ncbi:MAG: LacI family DNA-binding transcriptional regulator [Verrucomicrobiota bacterium]
MSTLKEVAAEAGVHPGTVSAILNRASGNSRFSDATREKVERAAKKLSYVPNRSASILKKGTSNFVGFFGGDVRNPFFAELITALELSLRRKNLQLVTSQLTYAPDDSPELHIQSLLEQSVQAIVYWDESEKRFRRKFSKKENVLWLPVGFTRKRRPGIWLDLEHGIHQCVSYLKEKKCRNIYFFAPDPKQEKASPSLIDRIECFQQTCRAQRLRGIPVTFPGHSWDIQAARAGAESLIPRLAKEKRSAILTFNDVAGLGLVMAGLARNQVIPFSNCPLVCFDGTRMMRPWNPNITYLDLKIDSFVEAIQNAIISAPPPTSGGLLKTQHWLKPEINVPA